VEKWQQLHNSRLTIAKASEKVGRAVDQEA